MSLRIERFELRAFGPFTGTVLELIGAPGGCLHIICGPNEIGKSTAQRAIVDFLFGIPARSTDNQLHPYVDMRLGAELVDGLGARHELLRRKGNSSTLLTPAGDPVDEGGLERMLGGLSREVFESMFSITHDSLVVGGKALLAAGGEVGESLFSASLGASNLHHVRAELDAQAATLFRPRASSSLILQARSRLEAAEAELRERTLRATTFVENEREQVAAEAEREQLAAEIRTLRASQTVSRRQRSVIPLLAEREQLLRESAELGETPALPKDCMEQRVRAVERERGGKQGVTDAEARIADLEQRISMLTGDALLLEREQSIKDLHARLLSVREAGSDLERQRGKLQAATQLAQRALDDVRPDLDLDHASILLLGDRQRAKIDSALEHHTKLAALRESAQRAAEEHDEAALGVQQELEEIEEPPDTSGLRAAVDEVRDEGDVEGRLAEAKQNLRLLEGQLGDSLAQLLPPLAIDALRATSPPSVSAVERFAGKYDEIAERERRLTERAERLGADRRQLDEDHARLSVSGETPSLEALQLARVERDEEWSHVRERLDGDATVRISPDGFEDRVQHADEVSDRLRDHADAVARHGELGVREHRLEAEETDLETQLAKLADDRAEFVRSWAAAWSAIELEPGTPTEMAEWLRHRALVIERDGLATRQAEVAKAVTHTREQYRATLTAELVALGCEAPADASLRRLMGLAKAQLAAADSSRVQCAELAAQLRETQRSAARQHEQAEQSRLALEESSVQWTQLVEACSWPPDVEVESARRVLATVDELSRQLTEMARLNTRVNGIEGRLHTFDEDAAAVIAIAAADLGSWLAADAVAEIDRRLETAVHNRNRKQSLDEELSVARDELLDAKLAVESAERDLSSLIQIAGVATVDELSGVEQESMRAAAIQGRLPELERQITDVGEAPAAELSVAIAEMDVDMLDLQLAEADEQLAALEQQLADLDVRLGELGSDRQAMERGGGAAEAAQIAEQRIAELRELVAKYLRIYVAGWALSEAIDEYRREHKDPVLRRADELFPALTCGSFHALEVSFDERDEPVLVGVRATGERVAVTRMSTGTREQLYLALRLASLERHVELHGPMPVILDDVVLHSDPARKSAILIALAELGRTTQVIAFSHDPQVIALAQRAVDPKLVTVHELGGNAISGALHPVVDVAEVRRIKRAEAA
jgi:uncharacterized protein YhaN